MHLDKGDTVQFALRSIAESAAWYIHQDAGMTGALLAADRG